jgi:hypothetical protein
MKRRNFFLKMIMLFISLFQEQCNVKLHVTNNIIDTKVNSVIENNSSLFLSEMNRAFSEKRPPDFTNIAISPEASQTVLDIWNNTGMMNISKLNTKSLKQYGERYQVRDIPVSMPVAPDVKDKMTVSYTADGSIDNIRLSGDKVSAMLMKNSIDGNGLEILDFIECYYTAYKTRNLKFLKTVLLTDERNYDQNIVYDRIYKKEYLKKLEYLFKSKEYIGMEITEIELMQHPKYSEIYGVAIKQNLNTTYYNDTCYIYWVIDTKDKNAPIAINCTLLLKHDNGKSLLSTFLNFIRRL